MAGEYRSLKKQHYLNLIKECASSGKNKQQWCSENGIKYSTFMRWQALLRDEVADQVMEQQTIVPVKIAPPIVSAPHPDTALPQEILILSILVDTFISKISLPMQPVPEIGSISVA